jgi:hypothetical protein
MIDHDHQDRIDDNEILVDYQNHLVIDRVKYFREILNKSKILQFKFSFYFPPPTYYN